MEKSLATLIIFLIYISLAVMLIACEEEGEDNEEEDEENPIKIFNVTFEPYDEDSTKLVLATGHTKGSGAIAGCSWKYNGHDCGSDVGQMDRDSSDPYIFHEILLVDPWLTEECSPVLGFQCYDNYNNRTCAIRFYMSKIGFVYGDDKSCKKYESNSYFGMM